MPSPGPSTPENKTLVQTPSAPRHPSPEKPGLYLPTDRTGNEGYQDRRQRLERLQESIHLDASQLREIIKRIYKYDHACRAVDWRADILYRYVPRTFETAEVTEDVAYEALQEAIDLSLVRICRPSAYDVSRYTVRKPGAGNPRYTIFDVIWDGFTPQIPPELEGLPTLAFHEERRKVFWYPRSD
ncbi:uncharacterized protein LDX57_000312 [Aspergillus melleus]|uniref:uncharacterized protein n=1 Tax=Aspergillus melleus TaxID=138277 RepID=UPI001E8EE4D7|nr:uncharacterized protein LDX57_000312 [Aspergillus melleus]KAH8422559.1 hypothetical protein LDX57_000312 [Aspergillus melleus]